MDRLAVFPGLLLSILGMSMMAGQFYFEHRNPDRLLLSDLQEINGAVQYRRCRDSVNTCPQVEPLPEQNAAAVCTVAGATYSDCQGRNGYECRLTDDWWHPIWWDRCSTTNGTVLPAGQDRNCIGIQYTCANRFGFPGLVWNATFNRCVGTFDECP